MTTTVDELVERSNRLGADLRNTNYGGGNTSAKATIVDPASGDDVEIVWVKGSGSDLATLAPSDLAVLRRDRVLALQRVYRGTDHEDEMVPLFDHCCFGAPGPAPSIDTAMHSLVDAPHVDHLHPAGVIAIAASVDGRALTTQIYGDRVLWVDWRRPGFELGLQIAQLHRQHPEAIGVVLGGHGTTAWGDSSVECERNSLWMIRTAEEYLDRVGRAEPFGPVIDARRGLSPDERRTAARAIAPLIRASASQDEAVVGHWDDSPEILDFLSRERAEDLATMGTSCPDHYLRIKVAPMFVDCDPQAGGDETATVIASAHARYREEYAAYYDRHAQPDSPPMRGADPRIVLVPGIGMFSFGKDARSAQICGQYYRDAVNTMRGAEAVSRYCPIPESEKFRIEYWCLEEAKLQRTVAPPLSGTIVVVAAPSDIAEVIASRLADDGATVESAAADRPGGVGHLSDDLDRCIEQHGGVDVVVVAGLDHPTAAWSALASAAPRESSTCVVTVRDGAQPVTTTPLVDRRLEFVDVGVHDLRRDLDLVAKIVAEVVTGTIDASSDLNVCRPDCGDTGELDIPSQPEGEHT